MPRLIAPGILLAVLMLAALACGGGEEPGVGITARAAIMSADGESLGTVDLTQGPQGVLVRADLHGLPPGGHGFHIHSVGACTPDFSAAGGHFDPEGNSHGFLFGEGQHAGDLPNVIAHADGTAQAHIFTNDITLATDDDRSLFDEDGASIIVHANPDDYGEDAGVAGARIGCGVIQRT